MAARLLDVSAEDLLAGRSHGPLPPHDGLLLGALFESLVTLDVRVYAQAAQARVSHLQTWNDSGRHAYRDRDGVAVVPAALLGP